MQPVHLEQCLTVHGCPKLLRHKQPVAQKSRRADLDEEVLLELGSSLLVGLALGALLYQGVQVKAQVAYLVTQVLTSLSPASSATTIINNQIGITMMVIRITLFQLMLS